MKTSHAVSLFIATLLFALSPIALRASVDEGLDQFAPSTVKDYAETVRIDVRKALDSSGDAKLYRRALAEMRSFTEDIHLSSAGALGSVERREAVKTALVQFDTMLGLMIDRINESIDSTEARRSRLAAQPPTGEVVYHINLDEASKMVVAQLEYDGAELCQIKSALRKVRTGIQEDVKKL